MNSLYLVLDIQNDTSNVEGPAGDAPIGAQLRERKTIENTITAIEKARSAGIRVGFVRVGFSPDYRECPQNSPIFSAARKANRFQLGSWGTELHPSLDVRPEDLQIIKHRVSPFYATPLMAQLTALRIERIFCSGVSTAAVVQSTVRDGHDRDFSMVVLEDGCAAQSLEEHQASMQSIARFCQVVSVADVDFKA
ncbi:cysteine hydrolase family protein [Pseudochelatococcus lubricantis]|uniref:cysteine hydrolase family protein n=1 Tax=Pseudochelatococcus lubricantis TaxID=1538102 RepID=UPI0035E75EDC